MRKIENGQILTFEEYSLINDGLGNIGTFKKKGDSLHIMLDNQNKFYRIHLYNKKLTLTPVTSKYEIICDEGCTYIYTKTDNTQVNIQEENIISGKITFKEDDNEMAGVFIKNKTKNVLTVTDYYGQFVMKASKNDDIIINYPNMQMVEFKITDKKNYDIILEEYVHQKSPKEIRQEKRELRRKGFIKYEQ
ncbi:hypothetical protein [Flavobacterium flavigenum]|uniref:hypothetical protein n=1 Tax=Flavobacterium flavigenum TaxID=3003258 RepID=UPI002482BA8A|nr:hypothetical protein [Flavobacterium flavigenum]